MSTHLDEQQTKRLLRRQIGRVRRRIDGRIHDVRRQGQQLVSWRTTIERHPGLALLAALGVGLAAAYGVKRKDWLNHPAVRRARRMIRWTLARLWREGKQRWTGEPWQEPAPTAEGGEHEQR